MLTAEPEATNSDIPQHRGNMMMTYKLLQSDNKDILNLPGCQVPEVIQQSCSASMPTQEKETISSTVKS